MQGVGGVRYSVTKQNGLLAITKLCCELREEQDSVLPHPVPNPLAHGTDHSLKCARGECFQSVEECRIDLPGKKGACADEICPSGERCIFNRQQ